MHVDAHDPNLARGQIHRIANIFRAALKKHPAAFSQRPKGNVALLEIIRRRDRRQRRHQQCYQSHGFASLTNAFVHLTFILCRIVSAVKRLQDTGSASMEPGSGVIQFGFSLRARTLVACRVPAKSLAVWVSPFRATLANGEIK